MPPQLIYFDMGNVVLRFSHERMAARMAGVVGIDPAMARRILFENPGGLEWAYERGELTREQFYGRFCELAGRPADIDALDAAGNEIFDLNPPILGPIGRLAGAGYRLGICSNTTYSHWTYCTGQYRVLTKGFSLHALSFRLKAMKPNADFYAAATDLAGLQPSSIFFTDDREENVLGAIKAGWDAVVYESVSQLNDALRSRGVVMNY